MPVIKDSVSVGLKALLDLCEDRSLCEKIILPLLTFEKNIDFYKAENSLIQALSGLGSTSFTSSVLASNQEVGWTDHGRIFVNDSVARKVTDALFQVYEFCREPCVPVPPKTLAEIYRMAGYSF